MRRTSGGPEACPSRRRTRDYSIIGSLSSDWRSQAALAYARLDQPDAALAVAHEELELARRFGAARAIGIALRTLGIVGDDLDHLNKAVDVLAASAARLEHSRALSDLGIALRHRRRTVEAREPLRHALDLAIRCGALPLAERARTELLITGARPRRPQLIGVDALTINQRRVAAMAADGRSNREAAQALYMSHKTVEKHLTAAYRKLGSARARTCRALSQRVGTPPHTPPLAPSRCCRSMSTTPASCPCAVSASASAARRAARARRNPSRTGRAAAHRTPAAAMSSETEDR